MKINGFNPELYGAQLVNYSVEGCELKDTYFLAPSAIFPTRLQNKPRLRKITLTFDFEGTDTHDATKKMSDLTAILMEQADLLMPDKFYYYCVLTGTGKATTKAPWIEQCTYTLILWRIADLKELSKGFSVFVLKCVDDSGVCGMLENNRCSIYSARPRTCRQYPFAAEPCEQERRIKWYLCTEQSHHFSGGTVTARHWQRKNMPADEEEYLYAECKTLPELGRLLEKMPDNQLTKAEQLIVAFRYLAYDFSQPFLPQYKDNMMVLRAQLEELCQRP